MWKRGLDHVRDIGTCALSDNLIAHTDSTPFYHLRQNALPPALHFASQALANLIHLVAWSPGFVKMKNRLADLDVAANQRHEVDADSLDVRPNGARRDGLHA